MNYPNTLFRTNLKEEFSSKIVDLQNEIDLSSSLRMDLHCHDKNSDVPDELWGRILGIPETWLKTSSLVELLYFNKANAITITNHNNARSCWRLLDKGIDILVGAEFTCLYKEYNVYIHVLAYGFTPEQEAKLNHLRKNIYLFCQYCIENNIPTILPHPTYLYNKFNDVPLELLEKLALLFERFEVLNGQRDIWQNLLTLTWLQGLQEEKIHQLEVKHGLRSSDFCKHPTRKTYSGGSDDHMGIFAGNCGTWIQVDDYINRKSQVPLSVLALEGLRQNNMAPYGHLGNVNEKLNMAFLDYFCQVTLNMKDPGLTRLFLHKGDVRDKMFCWGIANGIFELRRHAHTMNFMKTLHKAIRGKKPSVFKKLFISKAYRPMFDKAAEVSTAKDKGPDAHIQAMRDFIEQVYGQLNNVIVDRLREKFKNNNSQKLISMDWGDILNRLEIPVQLRALVNGENCGDEKMNSLSLGHFFDRLSFPILASVVLAASTYTSTKVMFNSRNLLNDLSESIDAYQHPKRILWLTDTLYDKNGVSMYLQQFLAWIREHNCPIDILTCGPESRQEDHLHVIRQVCEFKIPQYEEQIFRIPNLMDIQKIFYEGAYDRVVCSTEMMGGLALYLKTAFYVPAYFYMHTDWMDFAKRSIHLEHEALSRLRRMLRFYYQQFDGVFVLNEEHAQWLTGLDMGIPSERVYKTAHWAPRYFLNQTIEPFSPRTLSKLLYVGRLSDEKGVYDLPILMQYLNECGIPVELTIIGDGPAKASLIQRLPEALFLGWKNQSDLPAYYQQADLLILPSRFDTFGCVVLEAMACGCPVVAYNCKGPKDIIEHERSGYLPNDIDELNAIVHKHLSKTPDLEMRLKAIERSKKYDAKIVIEKLMADLEMVTI